MVKVYIHGMMVLLIMEIGKMEKLMVLVRWSGKMGFLILGSGLWVFFMERENFFKKMVVNMKENFFLVKNKVMEF